MVVDPNIEGVVVVVEAPVFPNENDGVVVVCAVCPNPEKTGLFACVEEEPNSPPVVPVVVAGVVDPNNPPDVVVALVPDKPPNMLGCVVVVVPNAFVVAG